VNSSNDSKRENYLAELNLSGKRNVWFKNRGKIDFIFKVNNKFMADRKKHLDIGIGDGYCLELSHRKGKKATGLDISEFSVNHLKQQFLEKGWAIDLISADIAEKPLEKESFDLVTALDVIEHLPVNGLVPAIRNIHHTLTVGGVFVFTIPLNENLELGMTMCPKCGEIFHRIGHNHSFRSIEDIKNLTAGLFDIISFGTVKADFGFKSYIKSFLIKLSIWFKLINDNGVKTIYVVAKKRTDETPPVHRSPILEKK
jgi:2-polyprenyl-3-methyl-5-hydroxy-6-metoxy-1,4-benzoquinol methylase